MRLIAFGLPDTVGNKDASFFVGTDEVQHIVENGGVACKVIEDHSVLVWMDDKGKWRGIVERSKETLSEAAGDKFTDIDDWLILWIY